jgi:hypothetical protein
VKRAALGVLLLLAGCAHNGKTPASGPEDFHAVAWRTHLRDAIINDRVTTIRASMPYGGGGGIGRSYKLTITRDGHASISVPLLRPYWYRGPRVIYAHAPITHAALREIELSALRLSPSAPIREMSDPGMHITISTRDDHFEADGSVDWGYWLFAAHLNQFVRDADWQPKVEWIQE